MVAWQDHQPGWPAELTDGPVRLRPYRRGDAAQWSAVRLANEAWLAPWEPRPLGPWEELNSRRAYRWVLQDQRRSLRDGTAMPFAIVLAGAGAGAGDAGRAGRRGSSAIGEATDPGRRLGSHWRRE